MNLGAMPERNRTIVNLYEVEGWTTERIGAGFKPPISGQRVRQILKRAGIKRRTIADYDYRISWVCSACGATKRFRHEEARRRKVCSYQCSGKLKTRWNRPMLIDYLQQLAADLGHTPSIGDINLAGPPDHMTYVRNFGSICAAQEAAGLVPNAVGRRAAPFTRDPEGTTMT